MASPQLLLCSSWEPDANGSCTLGPREGVHTGLLPTLPQSCQFSFPNTCRRTQGSLILVPRAWKWYKLTELALLLDISLAGPGSIAAKTISPSGKENKTGAPEADFPNFSATTACITSGNCCCSSYQPAPLRLVGEKLRNAKALRESNISSPLDGAAHKRICIFKMWFGLRINTFVDSFTVHSAEALPLEGSGTAESKCQGEAQPSRSPTAENKPFIS